MFCLGCGVDLTGKESDRRNLRGSEDIILLWKAFIEHVAVNSADIDVDHLLAGGGLMCFYAYKKYIGLQESLEDNLGKSLEVISAACVKRPRISACAGHSRKQVPVILTGSSSQSSTSPDVAVSLF